jgi:hypothetical protein
MQIPILLFYFLIFINIEKENNTEVNQNKKNPVDRTDFELQLVHKDIEISHLQKAKDENFEKV